MLELESRTNYCIRVGSGARERDGTRSRLYISEGDRDLACDRHEATVVRDELDTACFSDSHVTGVVCAQPARRPVRNSREVGLDPLEPGFIQGRCEFEEIVFRPAPAAACDVDALESQKRSRDYH